VVVAGKARFEFLTPALVRYRLHSGRFKPRTLDVSWRNRGGSVHTWHPEQINAGDLGGLTDSLDNVSRNNLPSGQHDRESPVHDLIPGIDVWLARAQPGLLSRSGYGLINDSGTPVWNRAHTGIEPRRPRNDQDWYLFAYGACYRRALSEYAELYGRVPMIPRYVLGPMVTDMNFEYFPGSAPDRRPRFARYGEQHVKQELTRLRHDHIPVDTLVLDYGWHDYGWQDGYDWSPLFPHPRRFMHWLHARGVNLALNDHPGYANTDASDLSYHDSQAEEVLRDLGRPLPARPTFTLDLARHWRFSAGPYTPGSAGRGATWRPIHVGLSWQDQGARGRNGVGWYRARIRLPEQLPAHLYLYLGGLSGPYRLFVNGNAVPHDHVRWPQRRTYADVSAAIVAGAVNRFALRVRSGPQGGGLLFTPTVLRDVPPHTAHPVQPRPAAPGTDLHARPARALGACRGDFLVGRRR